MFDPLSLLLEVGKTTLDLLGKSQVKKDARKGKVADYLEEISKTIQDAANVFKQGQVPHGSCETMRILALSIPSTIGDFVGKNEALDLQDKLLQAHNIEKFMYDLGKNDKKERAETLAKMEQAAGLFKAAAISLRATG
jgi:hypothetical protein